MPVTRAEVGRRLELSSGSSTEITARLRGLDLVTETPAAVTGRGRPTTVLWLTIWVSMRARRA